MYSKHKSVKWLEKPLALPLYILQCHFYMPNFYSLPSHTYKMPLTNYTNIFGPSFSSYYSLEMQCSIRVYLWVNLTPKTKLGTKDAIPWQGELLWQCKERFPSQLKQFKSKAKYSFWVSQCHLKALYCHTKIFFFVSTSSNWTHIFNIDS